jgi:hypothetical protein
MTEIIELCPDKSLINLAFEKYQFFNDIVPITLEIKLRKGKFNSQFVK